MKKNDDEHAILKKSIKKTQFNSWKFITFHRPLENAYRPPVEKNYTISV